MVITTTLGPLDIELWPKEAPKAVRSLIPFLALLVLCLSGTALLTMKKALVVNALIIARGGVYIQRCYIRVCELSVGFYFVRRPLSLDTNLFSSNVIVEMVQFACRFAILCSCVWMATTMVPCFTGLSKPSWCKVAIPQELEQARFHRTCENSQLAPMCKLM